MKKYVFRTESFKKFVIIKFLTIRFTILHVKWLISSLTSIFTFILIDKKFFQTLVDGSTINKNTLVQLLTSHGESLKKCVQSFATYYNQPVHKWWYFPALSTLKKNIIVTIKKLLFVSKDNCSQIILIGGLFMQLCNASECGLYWDEIQICLVGTVIATWVTSYVLIGRKGGVIKLVYEFCFFNALSTILRQNLPLTLHWLKGIV